MGVLMNFFNKLEFPYKSFILLIVGYVILKIYLRGNKYKSKTRLDGQTVIITGANSGIGKEIAKDLFRRGAKVILACRNVTRACKCAIEIRNQSGCGGRVVVKHLDLASFKSIRQFVKDIERTEDRLDVLINNAGVLFCPYSKTEDGYEMHFGVNHLGHFLLTNLLLNLLKKSAPSRIVTVSSYTHAGTGVTTYSLHPGVSRTSIGRHIWCHFPWLRPVLFLYMKLPLFKNCEEGAQTIIFCVVDKSLQKDTGKYYRECKEVKPSKQALDNYVSNKLWDLSVQLVGLESSEVS